MDLQGKIRDSGLLKKFIAEKVGKSPQYLSQMLNGKANMPEHVEKQILIILEQAKKIK